MRLMRDFGRVAKYSALRRAFASFLMRRLCASLEYFLEAPAPVALATCLDFFNDLFPLFFLGVFELLLVLLTMKIAPVNRGHVKSALIIAPHGPPLHRTSLLFNAENLLRNSTSRSGRGIIG